MSRKQPSSPFVAAAGTSFEIISALSHAVNKLGGSDEDLRRILRDPQLVADLAARIVNGPFDGRQSYQYFVDYTKSVEEMIVANRYSGYRNTLISSANFSYLMDGTGCIVTAEVVEFGASISTRDALGELKKRGLRPATMAELLEFGPSFSTMKPKFSVVALSSFCFDFFQRRHYGILSSVSSCRFINLIACDDVWDVNVRFLGIRV
jgi:hypothetical protein